MINVRNELIEKYLDNKHNTLCSYAETLFKVYEIQDEKLWNTEEEFRKLIRLILKIYIVKYYLRDKKELNSLNVNNLEEKDFKMTLSLSVVADYFGSKYEEVKNNYKKSIYNLTLIVYIVTNTDKEISFYGNKGVTIKNIIEKINELFKDVLKDVDIKKNPFVLEMLANKIRDAERKEIRFFESLKDTESFITFSKYSNNHYFADYNYNLKKLDNYSEVDIRHIYQKFKYKEVFMPIVYDLVCISILKAFSNNCYVPIIMVPITSKYLSNNTNINTINNIFSNIYIKKHINLSVHYSDYKKNVSKFETLKDLGFKLALFIDENEIITDYSNIKFDYKFYVKEKFIENNPKFLTFIEQGNVKYSIIQKINYMSEDEFIHQNLKESV